MPSIEIEIFKNESIMFNTDTKNFECLIGEDKKIFLNSETGYFCAYEKPIEFGGYEFVFPEEYKQMKIN